MRAKQKGEKKERNGEVLTGVMGHEQGPCCWDFFFLLGLDSMHCTHVGDFILFLPENHINYALFSHKIYSKDVKVGKIKSKNSYKI